MAASSLYLIALFMLVLMAAAQPLATVLAAMTEGRLPRWLIQLETPLWRLAGIRTQEMNWRQYLGAVISLNFLGLLFLFALLLGQGHLPPNPQHFPRLPWDLALNTAVSFVTNTDWQVYAGESTLSYLSQMAGLTVQNCLSAATGIAVAFALIRTFARQGVSTLGNAWQDVTRITLWLLLPLVPPTTAG